MSSFLLMNFSFRPVSFHLLFPFLTPKTTGTKPFLVSNRHRRCWMPLIPRMPSSLTWDEPDPHDARNRRTGMKKRMLTVSQHLEHRTGIFPCTANGLRPALAALASFLHVHGCPSPTAPAAQQQRDDDGSPSESDPCKIKTWLAHSTLSRLLYVPRTQDCRRTARSTVTVREALLLFSLTWSFLSLPQDDKMERDPSGSPLLSFFPRLCLIICSVAAGRWQR
ncbi:hypothetical protein B0H66DRAFT_287869 [Apodospora peruviana]|uniref:Uncharacterized protein n=1 Tax=Apodospora peruviana TaxID=516989 RepID=A0AAE0I0H0_9PEZI|nr:hypothetical protein B0H66DRAFT_287869 [Apodospora peruviana]